MPAYRTVVFDCDSTLSAVEGIEELAAMRGVSVEAMTEAAMRGEIPLEAVYGKRLEAADPSRDDMATIGRRYIEEVVPDAAVVVAALQAAGIEVRVLSGGLKPPVLMLTRHLGIPDSAVHAVDIHFDERGSYAGYDTESPMARSGGKPDVITSWLHALSRPLMLVGDGATDLETAPVVDLFVAFAGAVDRPEVTAGAGAVIRELELAPVVALALGDDAPDRQADREIWERGRALLGP